MTNAQSFIKKELLVVSQEDEKYQILKATDKGKFLIDGIASDLFMI